MQRFAKFDPQRFCEGYCVYGTSFVWAVLDLAAPTLVTFLCHSTSKCEDSKKSDLVKSQEQYVSGAKWLRIQAALMITYPIYDVKVNAYAVFIDRSAPLFVYNCVICFVMLVLSLFI